jgi:membrane protein
MFRPILSLPPSSARARRPPLRPDGSGPLALVRAILAATLRDGFTHAGNIAYLALLALFPAAILLTGLAASFGRTDAGDAAIAAFLQSLPPASAATIGPAIAGIVSARTTGLFTLSAIVGLWTLSSLLETLRRIIRKAHGLERIRPVLVLRLASGLLAVLFLLLTLAALAAGVLADIASIPLARLAPALPDLARFLSPLVLFGGLWLMFALLHPWRVRPRIAWPGALVVAIVWTGAARLTGPALAWLGTFDRTYGALTGIMVTLLFFWILGFALVAGAETNAALSRRSRLGLWADSTEARGSS